MNKLLILASLAGAGVFAIFRMKKAQTSYPAETVYGDAFGGTPPVSESDYFPRLGFNQPLPDFQQSAGIPQYPVNPLPMPQIVAPDLQVATPPPPAKDEKKSGSACTEVCNSCAGDSSPFNSPSNKLGADLFDKAAENLKSFDFGALPESPESGYTFDLGAYSARIVQ